MPIFGLILGALKLPLRLIRDYPWQAALVAVSVFTWLQWTAKNDAREERDQAEAALVQQIEDYQEAYTKAFLEHWIAKRKEDDRLRKAKDDTDDETDLARARALDGASAYARANRVRQCPTETNSGDPRSSGMPGAPSTPESVEGASPAVDMVAVSRADFDACTLNTQDLGTAFRWGARLSDGDGRREPTE